MYLKELKHSKGVTVSILLMKKSVQHIHKMYRNDNWAIKLTKEEERVRKWANSSRNALLCSSLRIIWFYFSAAVMRWVVCDMWWLKTKSMLRLFHNWNMGFQCLTSINAISALSISFRLLYKHLLYIWIFQKNQSNAVLKMHSLHIRQNMPKYDHLNRIWRQYHYLYDLYLRYWIALHCIHFLYK